MSSASTSARTIEQEKSPIRQRNPTSNDAQAVRFGWSAGRDIDLSQRTGSRFVGRFENERIPRRVLVPFTEAWTLAPNELMAVVGSRPEDMDVDILSTLETEGDDRPLSRILRRQPRSVAYDLMRDEEAYGLCLFEQLRGEENWPTLQEFYDILLPIEAFAPGAPLAAVSRESVLGGYVTRTFLDQYRAYLLREARTNLENSGLSKARKPYMVRGQDGKEYEAYEPSMLDLCEGVLNELVGACNRAWAHQKKVLAESTQEIQQRNNGGKGKIWYDERDADYLVETDTTPLNRTEVQASREVGEQLKDGIVTGMRALLAEVRPQPVQVLQPSISPEVERVLAENAALRAQMEEVLALVRGGAQQPPAAEAAEEVPGGVPDMVLEGAFEVGAGGAEEGAES